MAAPPVAHERHGGGRRHCHRRAVQPARLSTRLSRRRPQELDRLGAHVLVVPKGCPYDAASMALHGASWPCYLKQRYLEEVRAVAGVATAAPVFMTAVYDAGATQTVYVGVETNILALKRGWQIEGTFPAHEDDLLIGSEIAKRNGWQIGQQVPLPGVSNQTGTVAGILAPTQSADDTFIYLAPRRRTTDVSSHQRVDPHPRPARRP